MSTVTIAGSTTLHYRLHYGALQPAGPPALLVHGAGGNLMHWPGDLRRMPAHTICALDLPGHGKSPGKSCASIGDYAEVVRGFDDALGLSPFVLAGHSMGGAIALEFALRYGGRLAGLVLIGASARLRVAPQILSGIRNGFPATSGPGRGIADMLATWACGEHADPNLVRLYARRLQGVDPQTLLADYAASDAFDRTADVARIAVPALVICGEADRVTPVEQSRDLAERIGGARLLAVPGAGHAVMSERPAQVAAAVSRFLDDLAVAR